MKDVAGELGWSGNWSKTPCSVDVSGGALSCETAGREVVPISVRSGSTPGWEEEVGLCTFIRPGNTRSRGLGTGDDEGDVGIARLGRTATPGKRCSLKDVAGGRGGSFNSSKAPCLVGISCGALSCETAGRGAVPILVRSDSTPGSVSRKIVRRDK